MDFFFLPEPRSWCGLLAAPRARLRLLRVGVSRCCCSCLLAVDRKRASEVGTVRRTACNAGRDRRQRCYEGLVLRAVKRGLEPSRRVPEREDNDVGGGRWRWR